MSKKFDVNQVINEFHHKRFPEQGEMMRELRDVTNTSVPFKKILHDVMQACADQEANPLQSMTSAMVYGIAMGIYLERERAGRVRVN